MVTFQLLRLFQTNILSIILNLTKIYVCVCFCEVTQNIAKFFKIACKKVLFLVKLQAPACKFAHNNSNKTFS